MAGATTRPAGVDRMLAPNNRMWFCDGRLNFLVDGFHDGFVAAHLVEGTIPLKSSNALFLPDSSSGFTAITQLDRDLLKEFAAAKVVPDWVALSLIASPQDVYAKAARKPKSASVPKSE
jgi:pyruvate kinase